MTDPTPAEARTIGIVADRWPYGPNIDPQARRDLLTWATALNLRYSPNGKCLHWLTRGRCTTTHCLDGHNRHPWMDHVTGWCHQGKPALLVTQPYWLTLDCIEDLTQVAHTHNLDVQINGTGWYGHGTTLIELRPSAHPNASGSCGENDAREVTPASLRDDLDRVHTHSAHTSSDLPRRRRQRMDDPSGRECP